MIDFTAVDFETANEHRGSPCSVGLVKVRDGVIIDERHRLVRPPDAVKWFAPFNTALHGMTSSSVERAPSWRDVLSNLVEFVEGNVVVAHNASFDIGVVRYACIADGIAWPSLRFACTLVLSRLQLALPTYRLPYVAAELGVRLDHHHDALVDARATAQVLITLARMEGATGVEELLAGQGVRVGTMMSGSYSPTARAATSRSLVVDGPDRGADPDGYLFGRVVVFTVHWRR